MVRSKTNIVIRRESNDRAILKTTFKGHNFWGEIAYIPIGKDKVFLKCISNISFYKPYLSMVFRECLRLRVDESTVLKVLIDK